MKCTYCGKEMKKGDKFCGKCGKKALNEKIYQFKQFIIRNKKSLGITIIAILIFLIICNIISIITSPITLANNYFKAIVNNDTSKIFDYITDDENIFVMEDILNEKMDKIEITNYEMIKANISKNNGYVVYNYISNGKNYNAIVKLNKTGKFLWFDIWKIDSSKISENISFKIPKESKILIDNMDISDYKIETEGNYDIYTIDKMITGEYKIQVDLKDGNSITDTVDIEENSVYNISSIDLNDELKIELTNKAKDLITTIYKSIIEDKSFDEIEELKNIDTLKESYKNLRLLAKNRNYKISSIDFDDITIKKANYDDDARLVIEFTTDFSYNLLNSTNSEEYTGFNRGTFKVIYDYSNNCYNIYDININLKI